MKEDSADKCPICGCTDLSFGYGFAGGGLGVYTLCLGCDEILTKTRDDVERGE